MKENVNSWLIKEDYYDRNKKRRERQKNSRRTNFNVFVCPACNRVHEVYYFNGKGVQTSYHEDFPRYKLQENECIECDGQSLGGNNKTSIR